MLQKFLFLVFLSLQSSRSNVGCLLLESHQFECNQYLLAIEHEKTKKTKTKQNQSAARINCGTEKWQVGFKKQVNADVWNKI